MIKLKINEKNLVANLSNAFTSNINLFTELAQNARRAGAKKVKFTMDEKARTFTVEDDGKGISDFQNLFTVAESGWSKETVAQENPFGMGFLIAIYLSDSLEVESLDRKLSATKSEILEGNEIKVTPAPTRKGTKITLKGVEKDVFKSNYKQALKGFSIPVEVNGEEVERNHALDYLAEQDNLIKEDFWFGTLYTYELGKLSTHNFMNYYFQGLPLDGNSIYGNGMIVHLKESEFKVRMPDRDCLLNQTEEYQRIQKTIQEWQVAEIQKHGDDYEWLVDNFQSVLAHKQLELFNKFNKVPSKFLSVIDAYQAHNNSNSEYHNQAISEPRQKEFTKQELMDRKIVAPIDWDFCLWEKNNDFALFSYLHLVEALIIEDCVPSSHWLYKLCTTKEALEESFEVGVDNLRDPQVSPSVYSDESEFKMCDSFTLDSVFGMVEVKDFALTLLCNNEYITVFPSEVRSGEIVTQINSFNGEYSYDESMEQEYYNNMEEWLLQERTAGSPDLIIAHALESIGREVPTLKGKKFEVSFDAEGNLKVVAI